MVSYAVFGFVALAMVSAAAEEAGAAKPYELGVAVSALVARLLVAEGAHVGAGDALLAMDCRPREEAIKVRAAEAAAAEAAYERVRSGSRPEDVEIGEANVGVAQARAEEAADALARLKGLTEGLSVARAQLLETRRDARVSAAQLEDARKRLQLLKVGSRQEDVAEFAARRDAAAAELSLAQAYLAQCTVRAPVAGTVHFLATPGQFFSQDAPATLARLTPDAKP